MYKYRFNIAGLRLRVETDYPVAVSQAFLPFLVDSGEAEDYFVRFHEVKKLSDVCEKLLFQGFCFRVHMGKDDGYRRSFYTDMEWQNRYAVGDYDYVNGRIEISYLPETAAAVSGMGNCFLHMGLESLMIRRNRLCFHAACISTHMGGILFTGPSGIGKSTQAQLWCQHRNATQINGDRPILSCDDGQWRAWGSPYAGSSRCYINESTPVSCIVVLRQAAECAVRRLSPGEAFRSVYAGVTANSWDVEYMQRSCDLILGLIERIPVYEYSCTADFNAVEYLEKILWKDMAQ